MLLRIVIKSAYRRDLQQAQFDLVGNLNDQGNKFHVGDFIDAPIFKNLGAVQVVSRVQHRGKGKPQLIIYCKGNGSLQSMLVEKYPDIQDTPRSAQLPPQDWR